MENEESKAENPVKTPENPPETPENPDETPENPPETPENPGETPEEPGWPEGIAPERLESLLAYCKLSELRDDPEVMVLIPELYLYAVQYLAGAGIGQPEKDAPWRAQYDFCVNVLVLDAWERREATVVATVVADNPVFRKTLVQLKQSQLEWDL